MEFIMTPVVVYPKEITVLIEINAHVHAGKRGLNWCKRNVRYKEWYEKNIIPQFVEIYKLSKFIYLEAS